GQSAAYRPVVPYLVLQVYYEQKQFVELLAYIQKVKSNNDLVLKNQDEIALLTAEAYFFTQAYATAAQYYEDYIALKDFAATSEVLYRTGYALYQAGEAYKALKYFKELAIQQDAVGQAASYYAGLIYRKAKQKMLALPAFNKARQASFSTEIQQEAAFQYAQLSYELGQFANTIETLQNFRQMYTDSQRLSEADALLSEAYVRTNDYDLAIAHIENMEDKPQSILKAYQKVTFYKGSEYFNNAAYAEAIPLFHKSLRQPLDFALALKAQLWLGESLSALQKYEEAQGAYRQVLDKGDSTTATYRQALYGLGYAYFNTAQYAQALPQFIHYTQQAVKKAPKRWLQDAWLRTADCYYATKEYQKALQLYRKTARYHPAYAYYHQGVIHGLLGNKAAAHASMEVIFKEHTRSAYYEKALFELGRIDLVQNDYPQAVGILTRLIQKRPESPLIPDALLQRAIAYVNLEKYSLAIQDYEQLLQAHPHHPNVQNSLLELSKIYKLAGKPQAFEQYLAAYKAANPENIALEQLAFDTAKGHFYDQRYKAVLIQLHQFLARYPKSKWTSEAHFLVAEAYYRQGNPEKAFKAYQIAIKEKQAPFYNKILLRLATLAYQKQDFKQALQHYQALKERAKGKRETYYAVEGIMKTNHALHHYDAVRQSASQILEQGNLAVNATNEATLFLGKAAMQQGKRKEAQAHFKKLVQGGNNIHAAEAQYLLAQLHYNAKEYQQSLKALFDLNKQFPAYKAWTNQGFLLIADNYIALEEIFQAKATLQSIIDNAGDKNIVAAAREKLKSLPEASQGDAQLKDTTQKVPAEDPEFKTLED
ncbi:MAG: tetratricopeptide repeat protein, partial [Bacteroidota bacterium]